MMMPKKSGSIISISSIGAFVGWDRRIYDGLDMRPNLVDYAASKAGIIGFTRDAAAELGPHGIRINAISPGGMDRSSLGREFVRCYADRTIPGRMGKDGWDIKGAAVFLASEASA
jgi:NAD(P)-dependent dehydrogenase (short-subunit alcohol dehydrogenase family)